MYISQRKRQKTSRRLTAEKSDFFDVLPDDIVVCVLSKLSAAASCPSDFINILLTCKRLNRLALHPLVLSKAGPKAFAVKAKNWSDSAHRFFKHCVNSGNTEASYTLGMIRFYCLENRGSGTSLMAKAAMKSHAAALYSLAIMQFNGSGGSKTDKDLRAGVSLCVRAAVLGHVDALRELGHCLQDGYGVAQNIPEGRRLLVHSNARELAFSLCSMLTWQPNNNPHRQYATRAMTESVECPLLSDFGCNVPAREVHPANQFLKEWFESGLGVIGPDLRLCSHSGCGRPETRPHEFRRCSVCGSVNYCSRGCQALDWKVRHKTECVPMEQWRGAVDGGGGDEIGGMVEIEGNENVAMIH
ncbi:F-box protein At5g50450 [Mercurialis annua]|uniref:F-box protein At5g50450 n=1 Tax=Mercurialis annua TaxID=3986 RepID=UPI00215F343B|nr:F-box protein At5g50450 [Mercurialis annua]